MTKYFPEPKIEGSTEKQLVKQLQMNTRIKDNMFVDFKIVQSKLNIQIASLQLIRHQEAALKPDSQGISK